MYTLYSNVYCSYIKGIWVGIFENNYLEYILYTQTYFTLYT